MAGVLLPQTNRSGQAQHAIAGFRYQLFQSVLALLQLKDGEELWLEVSEDYSIVSQTDQTDVQVKSSQASLGPPAFSLRLQMVRDALVRFWDQQASTTTGRRLVFMARGGSAVERGYSLPGGLTGIAYWQAAAIDADTFPLRTLLTEEVKGSPLANWLLTNPSDTELRNKLLRRVSWQLEEASADELVLTVRDELRRTYRSMGLPVSAADIAVSGLYALVSERASKPEIEGRKLTKVDLEAALERFAGDKMVVEQRTRAPALVENLLISRPDLHALIARRHSTVRTLIEDAKGQPLIWLYGAHGVGKSTLVRLVAAAMGGRWAVLDLWPVKDDVMGAIGAWREVTELARAGEIDGIILDNVVDDAGQAVLDRIGVLQATFIASGGRVIATSHQAPNSMPIAGLPSPLSVSAPYFSDDDVEELVGQAPAPSPDMIKAWALFVKVSSSGGHPALVTTKIAGLRARNWPNSALLEDIQHPSEATRHTREGARRQLLRELRDLDQALSLESRQLLRRIASVYDRVDEGLIRKLAAVDPPLFTVGDAIAVLKGTWLEVLAKGDMRVSPLIADIASDIAVAEGNRYRQVAAVHWISERVLDERTLPLAFWNAFLGKHDWVLIKLSETMQGLDAEKLRAAAPMLSSLTIFVTDANLYDGNPIAGVAVRVLQFAVADALDEQDIATRAAERLLIELEDLPEPVKAMVTAVDAMRVLLAEADLNAELRLRYAFKLREALPSLSDISDRMPDVNRMLPTQLRPDMDVSDALMLRLVQKVRSTALFLQALEAFDRIAAEDRNRFLDAISLMYGSLSVFVSSGWSGDHFAGADMTVALAGYERARITVAKWKRPDLSLEVSIAKSVILDEYLDQKPEALALIEGVIAETGSSPPAVRQMARVLSHMERYEESADLTLSVEDSLSTDDLLERALALRDGAVAFAKSDRLAQARRLFGKSREILTVTDNRTPLRTGLLIEQSLVLWREGDRLGAVLLAADVLLELETYDLTISRQAERSHQFGRGLVGVFHTELDPADALSLPSFDFGQASQIELDSTELMRAPLGPLADSWRLLATVEAHYGGHAISELSMQKQTASLSVIIEKDYWRTRYAYAVFAGDCRGALEAMVRLDSLIGIPVSVSDKLQRANIELFSPGLPDPDRARTVSLFQQGVVDLIANQVLQGRYSTSVLRKFRSECSAVPGCSALVEPVLDAATQLYALGVEQREPFLAAGITIAADRVRNDAAARLHRDITLLAHTEFSLLRKSLTPAVAAFIVQGWTSLANEIGGEFKGAVHAAIAKSPDDVKTQAGAVLLLAKDWVQHSFAEGWFDVARRLGTGTFGIMPG